MLSSKAKYGLKAMAYLARHQDGGAVVIQEIAASENIPKKFLDSILLDLRKHGLLSSKKGKGGGYGLARRAELIRVGDVVRVLDGPLAPLPCVSRLSYRRCDDAGFKTQVQHRLIWQKPRWA